MLWLSTRDNQEWESRSPKFYEESATLRVLHPQESGADRFDFDELPESPKRYLPGRPGVRASPHAGPLGG